MEISRQEYWSGLPFPTPGYFPNSGTEPQSLASPILTGSFFTTNATWEALNALQAETIQILEMCRKNVSVYIHTHTHTYMNLL